jgi:hypothetical protein
MECVICDKKTRFYAVPCKHVHCLRCWNVIVECFICRKEIEYMQSTPYIKHISFWKRIYNYNLVLI